MDAIFYFDFGSPNAYFAHRLIPGIEARTGTRFRYVPVLLGGLFKLSGNQAPMLTFGNVPNKLAYERREIERLIAKHRLAQFRMNSHFPVNTLMLMRGAVAAQTEGVFETYVEAMFRAMWEQSCKLDDPAVLMQVLAGAGLPSDRLVARVQEQDVKDSLVASTQEAFVCGAFGVPTFRVGDELFFGKDRLGDVEDELMRHRDRL